MSVNFYTATKEEQAAELFRRARSGVQIIAEDILAMYANQKNWRQEYGPGGCMWVWQGPVICGYEAAEWLVGGVINP